MRTRSPGRSRSIAPAVVLHFAACAYVGESFEDPARYYANNVLGPGQAAADASPGT